MKVVSAISTFLRLLCSPEVSPIGCRLLEVEVDSESANLVFRKHYTPEALKLSFRKYCDCCSGGTMIAVPETRYLLEIGGPGYYDTGRTLRYKTERLSL